ncbi:PfkB family carbohydrate kinase [Cnuibacter sp. UC19_7]|uniref:PfkB family carbohydrate kinase n=1 Tax=Cnuibacter sp. UC19_7 TaxID=3350166 RepID=UPI00366FBAC6
MRIVVVGDTLLDVDVEGSSDRLAPDAPAPVVVVAQRVVRAGGAGLVATLLARDGHDVDLVTVLSRDGRAADIEEDLARIGRVHVVAARTEAPTPSKSRIRSSGHVVTRLDEDCGITPVPPVTVDMLAALEGADAIVVADYGRGLTADERLRAALHEVGHRIPLVWDPHPRGTRPVGSATVVTPNLAEARGFAGVSGDDSHAAAEAAVRLSEEWGVDAVLVTLGHDGALLHRPDAPPHLVPTTEVRGADTCGAGDRLAASIAGALASGAGLPSAVQSAVASVGRFLADGGVAALALPDNSRPLGGDADAALAVVRATRARGGTVVATGGCFDLLHAGHARTLAAARALGDCLVVCLNSDDSVRRLKGSERPIMGQEDRSDLLTALECVDAVLVFDEDTPVEALRRLEPDLWVKGGDYSADQLPETAVIGEWGGRTVTVPYFPGRSTTRLAGALSRVG